MWSQNTSKHTHHKHRLHSWQTRDYRITFAEIKQRVVVSTSSPSNWHLIDVKYESEDYFHDQPRVWLCCDTARWIINNLRQNIIRNTSLNIQTAIFVFLRTSAAVFWGFQYQLGSERKTEISTEICKLCYVSFFNQTSWLLVKKNKKSGWQWTVKTTKKKPHKFTPPWQRFVLLKVLVVVTAVLWVANYCSYFVFRSWKDAFLN